MLFAEEKKKEVPACQAEKLLKLLQTFVLDVLIAYKTFSSL